MCQGGECAAGIFPLRGFFNNPEEGGFAANQTSIFIGRECSMGENLCVLPGDVWRGRKHRSAPAPSL